MRPAPLMPSTNPALWVMATVALGLVVWARHHATPECRGETWRSRAFLGACAVAAVCYLSPLETLARYYLLSAHLAQITLVMAVMAPLMLMALPNRTTIRLPKPIAGALTVVTQPVFALVMVTIGFFIWHWAPLYDAALNDTALYDVEQFTYMAIALAFWWPIVQPFSSAARPGMGPVLRLGYILVATVPQTFGGITVALTGHVIYAGYGNGPSLVGWGALVDQEIAGSCIALLSKIALFAAFMVLFFHLMGSEDESSSSSDGGGGTNRIPPQRPLPGSPPVPSWVAELERDRTVPEPTPRHRPTPRVTTRPSVPTHERQPARR